MPILMEEKWFTPQEVAERLKINLKTVRRYLRKRTLKGYKVGIRGDWRIPESELIVFLKKSTEQYLSDDEK